MIRRLTAALLPIIICCGCYDRFGTPPDDNDAPAPNITISALHDMWRGKCVVINEDIVIRGEVTSDDSAGNFYRTFTIRDITGGAEIWAGPTDIHNIYPAGCNVTISLRGCAMDERNGVLQIGLPAEEYDYDELGYFQSALLLDRHITRENGVTDIDIPTLGITNLGIGLCGCPVTVKGLRHTSADGDEEDVWEGYAAFSDKYDNVIYTYTSSYTNFAAERIPGGEVSLTGILQRGKVPYAAGEHFIIKMRSNEDCSAHN